MAFYTGFASQPLQIQLYLMCFVVKIIHFAKAVCVGENPQLPHLLHLHIISEEWSLTLYTVALR
jgi:hypothetical protein